MEKFRLTFKKLQIYIFRNYSFHQFPQVKHNSTKPLTENYIQ